MTSIFGYTPDQHGAGRLRPDHRGRRDGRPGRAHRRRQVDARQADRRGSTSSQGGRILIDGHDIRTVELTVVPAPAGRRPAVAVPVRRHRRRQHPLPAAGRDRRAGPDRRRGRSAGGDWLAALPDGLDTEVGEHGRALSMGQRQLVALARLLIQDPAIVILDEATASVDPLTEAQISGGPRRRAGRPHLDRDRAPAVDHRARRPDHRAARGRDRRAGHPPVPARGRRRTTATSTTPTSATSPPTTAPAPASSK